MASSPRAWKANGIDFSATRKDLLEARHLPGYFYSSPEIFDLVVLRALNLDLEGVARLGFAGLLGEVIDLDAEDRATRRVS